MSSDIDQERKPNRPNTVQPFEGVYKGDLVPGMPPRVPPRVQVAIDFFKLTNTVCHAEVTEAERLCRADAVQVIHSYLHGPDYITFESK